MAKVVCWYVQSHRDPPQIRRLLRRLREGSEGPIVLRHDERGCPLDPAPLLALGGVYLLPPSGLQERGSFSCQVQPYLDCIAMLEREGIAYDWLVNLTAQDYPVTPVPKIEALLATTSADGFVRRWDVRAAASPWSWRKARMRYWYRYTRLGAGSEPWLRALRFVTKITPLYLYLDYGALVGVRRWRTPFGAGFRCYGGRSWWTVRREVARYLLEFLAARPDVLAHYRGTVAPEESLVPTVLVNADRFRLVDDDYRYVDYRGAVRGSPRTLTVDDLPELASRRYHFARKFDLSVDRAVLDRIDREIHGVSAPADTA